MTLSHSCEDVSEGGPVLVGLVSSSSSEATLWGLPGTGPEGDDWLLTSVCIISMTIWRTRYEIEESTETRHYTPGILVVVQSFGIS